MLSFELSYASPFLYTTYCDLLFVFAKQNPVSGGKNGVSGGNGEKTSKFRG
jgi:hypothetical protein